MNVKRAKIMKSGLSLNNSSTAYLKNSSTWYGKTMNDTMYEADSRYGKSFTNCKSDLHTWTVVSIPENFCLHTVHLLFFITSIDSLRHSKCTYSIDPRQSHGVINLLETNSASWQIRQILDDSHKLLPSSDSDSTWLDDANWLGVSIDTTVTLVVIAAAAAGSTVISRRRTLTESVDTGVEKEEKDQHFQEMWKRSRGTARRAETGVTADDVWEWCGESKRRSKCWTHSSMRVKLGPKNFPLFPSFFSLPQCTLVTQVQLVEVVKFNYLPSRVLCFTEITHRAR